MSNQEPQQPAIPKFDFVIAPDAFRAYCNQIEFAYSPWDVTFAINEMVGRDDAANTIKVVRHGAIVMTPGHAKALLQALAITVQTYEAQFGEIDLHKLQQGSVTQPATSAR